MAAVQTATSGSSSDIFASLGASSSSKKETQAEQIQDRFMKLLVTQLKNQDPLNPMDNAQMTSQLAQINQISGIEKLNTTLGQMLDIYNNGQGMQAAGLIGKYVLTAGNSLPLAGGTAMGGAKLDGPADQVTVKVMDAAGNLLQAQQLGAHDAGNFSFTWDGKKSDGTQMPNGSYNFRVEATRGGEKVNVTGLQVGMVNAVSRSSSGFLLDLGAQGNVSFQDVQQIL